MYPDWAGPAVAGFLALWLLVLSFLVWQQGKFLKLAFPKSGERDIRKKFEENIKAIEGFKGELANLADIVEAVKKDGLQHIQKVKLMRFNPYNDTGGDQSFVATFLDKKGSGIVVTSLHARSGTRVFGKEITAGKSTKHQLSKEEELVVKTAIEA